jgi:hypothetical protein
VQLDQGRDRPHARRGRRRRGGDLLLALREGLLPAGLNVQQPDRARV